MNRYIIHLVAHAHLDPVWLWDWREGLNEGISTCRSVLDLMDEFPEYSFVRGEAAIYSHLEKHDPWTLQRIRRRMKEGRWDVVGGNWIQPDHNLPLTETLIRQFVIGQDYFRKTLGVQPRVAWAPDSFGHPAGLPDILAGCGLDSFAFTRPEAHQLTLAEPAFWWEGTGGARVLAYRPLSGWYGCERHEVTKRLDATLALCPSQGLTNVGFFFGLGNHGGGASRHHLTEIEQWRQKHPEVTVVYSGLHRLMDAIRSEIGARKIALKVRRGELGRIFTGCYSSVSKFKWPFRRTENLALIVETASTLVGVAEGRKSASKLASVWEGLAFNSFHDILPGSSIERAIDEQIDWMGGVTHRLREVQFEVLNILARRIDTTVPKPPPDHPSAVPLLVWNPHPHAFNGYIEMEASLDYRPIWAYAGRDDEMPVEICGPDGSPLPYQKIRTEHDSIVGLPFRRRALVPVSLPPLGWQVMTMGWIEGAQKPEVKNPGKATGTDGEISNGLSTVKARVGEEGFTVTYAKTRHSIGKILLEVVEDRFGSWGDMRKNAPPEPVPPIRESWTGQQTELLESGPERATLWIRLAGKSSRIDLTCALYRDREAVEIGCRLLWNERSARLRFTIQGAASAAYEVPGGHTELNGQGDFPALGWAHVSGPNREFGFASDALASFSVLEGKFHATLVRASRYAAEREFTSTQEPWLPAVDAGELRCRVALSGSSLQETIALASSLNFTPLVQTVPAIEPRRTMLDRRGSFAEVLPARTWKLVALKPAEDGKGLVVRLQNLTDKSCVPRMVLFKTTLRLDQVKPRAIATWRLHERKGTWHALRCNHLEQPLKSRAK